MKSAIRSVGTTPCIEALDNVDESTGLILVIYSDIGLCSGEFIMWDIIWAIRWAIRWDCR